MHLFAILRDTTPRVQRVQISHDLQGKIEKLFCDQAEKFLEGMTEIAFDARHTPESDEYHYIPHFDDKEGLLEAPAHVLSVERFDVAKSLDCLVGLFVVTQVRGKKTACFQTFDRRHALSKGRFALIQLGDGFRKLEEEGFVLDSHVAVLLQGRRLMFRRFQVASRLFDLSEYFHEATKEELDEFAAHRSFYPTDAKQFMAIADGSRIRKQIALVLTSDILSKCPVSKIMRRAKSEVPNLNIQTRGSGTKIKIVLPNDRAELKELLDFLQENYYRGILSGTRFVANSKRVAAKSQQG